MGLLVARHEQVDGLVKAGLTVVKIEELLARQGVVVPYRTLHRFAWSGAGSAGRSDGAGRRRRAGRRVPGRLRPLGLLFDPETGRRRVVHALIFTAVLFAALLRVADASARPWPR